MAHNLLALMRALIVGIALPAAAMLALPAPAFATAPAPPAEVKRILVQEALRVPKISPALALAVAEIDSGFRPDAESAAGARGVMQIKPKIAKDEFGVSADELWYPRLNIQIGVAFLGQLLRQYDGRLDLALSHYNAGSAAAAAAAGGGARVVPATKLYVRRVLDRYQMNRTSTEVASLVQREGGPNPAPGRRAHGYRPAPATPVTSAEELARSIDTLRRKFRRRLARETGP